MISKYKKSIKQQIEKYCETNYRKIGKEYMKLGDGLFNHRCQYNAVQLVKQEKMKDVYSCIIFNDSEFPVVHFINRDFDDKFIDNTLGWKYELYDYYIIRKIDSSEYTKIDKMLMTIKESLLDHCSNKLLNKLFFIDVERLEI